MPRRSARGGVLRAARARSACGGGHQAAPPTHPAFAPGRRSARFGLHRRLLGPLRPERTHPALGPPRRSRRWPGRDSTRPSHHGAGFCVQLAAGNASGDASTGVIAINGTFTYTREGDQAESIKLHANLRPIDGDGLYSARTDITIDNGQPFTLDGHAITRAAEPDETPALLLLTGLAEGRSFRLMAGVGKVH